MKLVAPIVTTILLSWILYRKTGTWKPVEVWAKAEYDAQTGADKRPMRGQTYAEAHPDVTFAKDVYEGGQVKYKQGGRGATFENPITM